MQVTADAKNKSLSVTFTDEEWQVVARAGPAELRDVLTNYLRNRSAKFLDEDIEAISAKLKSATEAQVRTIKLTLGL
jgi:hypothetical protein